MEPALVSQAKAQRKGKMQNKAAAVVVATYRSEVEVHEPSVLVIQEVAVEI